MKPGLVTLLSETRVISEFITFAGDALLHGQPSPTPQSKSKGVLLIPGFLAADATLYPLAMRLRNLGHPTFFSGIWCNIDCPVRTMDRLKRALRTAVRQTGGKVAVIGHSLGGIYARELARRRPDEVDRAILLGAPLKHPLGSPNAGVRALAALVEKTHHDCLSAFGEPCAICGFDLPEAPPDVAETIIYTKSDGMIDWRSCIESGPRVEAIEVNSSHCGLPVSLETWNVLTSRLSGLPVPKTPRHRRRTPWRFGVPYLRLVRRPASAA
jgi:pimeloyl-ACP methyl ester carboxylesterase